MKLLLLCLLPSMCLGFLFQDRSVFFNNLARQLPNLLEPRAATRSNFAETRCLNGILQRNAQAAMSACRIPSSKTGTAGLLPGFQPDHAISYQDLLSNKANCALQTMGWQTRNGYLNRNIIRSDLNMEAAEEDQCYNSVTTISLNSVTRFMNSGNRDDLFRAGRTSLPAILTAQEAASITDTTKRLAYFACLKNRASARCGGDDDDDTCPKPLAPAVTISDFNKYWIDTGLVPEKFTNIPPPAIINIADGISLTKPGLEVIPDVLGEETTVNWDCSASTCDSGLYTYIIEDTGVAKDNFTDVQSFIHYVRYNAPCNAVERGDIGVTYKTQFAMDLTYNFVQMNPDVYRVHNPPITPNFHHKYIHQVYCQDRRLSPEDFGDLLQDQDCNQDILMARLRPEGDVSTFIDRLDLDPEPVAASSIHVTYTVKANEILCQDYLRCVGELFPVRPAEGFECESLQS